MERLPLFLDLSERRCLVVGGGQVAARKVTSLIGAGAVVTVIAPELVTDLLDQVRAGVVTHHPRAVRDADLEMPWWLVVAATDSSEVNGRVADLADRAATWCIRADTSTSTAASAAVGRAGEITIAVSTGGRHPGAAAWVRDQVIDAIGPDLVAAMALVAEVQDERGVEAPRPDWRAAVDSGMLALLREGRKAEAKERLLACLSSSSD